MSEYQEGPERKRVNSLDAIIGKPFHVLDDGFVRVIDYMGSDEAIVQAARISYGQGTKAVREDRGLIRYLLRHRHTTPFEMCEIKLHIRVPMDCWRQWIRHRTANVNEYSTRYSDAIDAAQRTPKDAWRAQSSLNRQGSGDVLPDEIGSSLTICEEELQAKSREVYRQRLAVGVAREQARKDLPLSTYTEAYWKIDLHNLLHFLSLRMDRHAQLEIRNYAEIIGNEIVAKWCPITWQAFLDYRINALSLSQPDVEIIRALLRDPSRVLDVAERNQFVRLEEGQITRLREGRELEEKLALLGLPAPWTVT